MTSKRFFLASLLAAFTLTAGMILTNVFVDAYGLFSDEEKMVIYNNERLSKYLLSYNYIPDNFEGILIGPSLSANMDTRKIAALKIYNASINGGNITGVRIIAENVIGRGRLKAMIVCLHPYLLKDHGRKTAYLVPGNYWMALGSLELMKNYAAGLLVWLQVKGQSFNEAGSNYIIHQRTGGNKSWGEIQKRAGEYRKDRKIFVDPAAVAELGSVLENARRHGIRIFAYYYPYHEDILMAMEEQHLAFREKIDGLFTGDDVVWDLNSPEYRAFRRDYGNYGDAIHLSEQGTRFIVRSVQEKLGKHLPR